MMFKRIINTFYAGSYANFQRIAYARKRKVKSIEALSGGQFESKRRKH
jgi:hypothetical protein